jgi:hypothetical protein
VRQVDRRHESCGCVQAAFHFTILLMNLFFFSMLLTGIALLIYLLVRSTGQDDASETPQDGEGQRSEDEFALPAEEGNQRLTQQEPPPKPDENVTTSRRNTPGRSHCPACGEAITAYDERCPSCEITFVADGSKSWTLGNAGPADGICLPPTEISE